jgi:lipoate synthase
MAVLEECRASGCIATIGDKAHPSIVHRQAKDWVKNYEIAALSRAAEKAAVGLKALARLVFRQNSHRIVILRVCDFIDFSREVIDL